jgi:hypothetical protein
MKKLFNKKLVVLITLVLVAVPTLFIVTGNNFAGNRSLSQPKYEVASSEEEPYAVYPESSGSQLYNYFIEVTEQGEYRVVNGSDGSISWSSPTFETVFQNTLNVGGKICFQPHKTFVCGSQINATSYSEVDGNGATINVLSNSLFPGLVFNNVTNSHWSDLNLVRTGTNSRNMVISSNMAVIYCTQYTDNSVVFDNVNFTSAVDNSGGSKSNTARFDFFASPIFNDCIFLGSVGTGGLGSAVYIWDWASPTFRNPTILARASGSLASGVEIEGGSSPTFMGGTITGGFGSSATGARIYNSAAPVFNDVVIRAGSNSSSCYGVDTAGVCLPTFNSGKIYGGVGGNGGTAVKIQGASAPVLKGVIITNDVTCLRWSYSTRDNGRFQPFSGRPYTLLSMEIFVSTPTPGATLNLGSTVGGNDIATGLDLSTSGYKYISNVCAEISKDGYMYATTNVPVTVGRFFVYYTVTTNYASSYSIDIGTTGSALIDSAMMITNRASDTIKIRDAAVTNLNWRIINSHIETLDKVHNYAVTATSSVTDVPIYNSIIISKIQNVTMAAATQQGTNWQLG